MGEQEKGIEDLEGIILSGHDVHLSDVVIGGNTITKTGFVERLLEEKGIKKGCDYQLNDLTVLLASASERMQDLDCFTAQTEIDSGKEENEVTVRINVQERKSRYFFNVSTDAILMKEEGMVSPSATLKGGIKNITGNADWVEGNWSRQYMPSVHELFFSYHRPLIFLGSFDAILSKGQLSLIERSYTLDTLLGSLSWTFGSFSLLYEATLRNLCPLPSSGVEIRRESGKSVKSCVRAEFDLETRDDPAAPSKGYNFNTSVELAGLAGDVHHLKTEVGFQYNVPLSFRSAINSAVSGVNRFALQIAFRGGSLFPFFSTARLPERFVLGGPISFRGFRYFGVGPRSSNRECLGGQSYFAGGLYLKFPAWFSKLPLSLSPQLFFNFGNLSFSNDPRHLFQRKNIRTTLGGGLVFRTPWGRLEMNVSCPWNALSYDQPYFHPQVGLSAKLI